ncbi:adenylate/guanylate cyclase domain-containing protein [Burkholderia cenocepacia]|uniref:adenylate/guanylate cyclase domain-containing protein n=1 Tax=Burkholderia cenocepacia TaxID=95486 RepID=UPI00097BF9B0|nr:adenylate/guanylate cyclase domain-containing protein [Burkholderia cenocepacia]AQQ17680.1 adenylate/guanylate cyclase domain-containing protein [Burkholderia cenocepacia]ONJ18043.1 adenylate/guanylate cyclase domain-containing protein [Burkholderia cenocepacia]ONN86802.1 adenylate/guanylate cyclase domain-containing protein [Burkholderia cenocepacia]ONN91937.1 adenylate/guanylate cyclase domain-containing protein [Burkholderia cenocepacia]ONN96282.1 adenylate/guanylate cyclase domain-conta
MALKDNLLAEVGAIFKDQWTETIGRVVPAPSAVGLGNKATRLEDAVVFYADLDGSTNMVDGRSWAFSAEIYKAFLHCAAKIVRDESGDITAYDGDRIMAIFIGDNKCDRAARAALKLKWAAINIIEPRMKAIYVSTDFKVKHTVGIDMSDLRAVRTGVRGDNDLVWVGRAANYAAKLNSLSSDYPTWITKSVYDGLSQSMKTYNSQTIWEARTWTPMNNLSIYRTHWGWQID